MIRPGRAQARETAAVERSYQAYSFPGPTLGWVSDHNLAMSQPGGAVILDNIFPTATGGILRRGCQQQASLADAEILTALTGTFDLTEESTTVTGSGTLAESELEEGSIIKIGGVNYTVDTISSDTSFTIVGGAEASVSGASGELVSFISDAEVKSLFAYQTGTTERLFAGCDGQIFNVSVSGTPTAEYAVTDGYWSVAQYTSTDGTSYLRGANGTDTPFVYDGSTFGTSPALTFDVSESTTADQLSYVWVYKNRFFFIQDGTLDAWYLPVGQIGGELAKFSLGGVFPLGGSLVFGATWSQETGDGLSSMCLFVTSNGEAAVYAGDDPASVDSWAKVGVYQIGKPKGPNSYFRRGGDVVVATDIGVIPISQALQKDAVSLSPSAMSFPIEDEWNDYSRNRENAWAAVTWTEGRMVAIALPTASGQTPTWLVANARTGRWARFTGWDASSLATFAGGLYFGSPDGFVYQAQTGGSDDGDPYVGVYVPSFDQLGVKGVKTAQMARAVLRSQRQVNLKISVHSDFRLKLPPAPAASEEGSTDVWGVGKWGEVVWGSQTSDPYIQDSWRSTVGEGEALTIAHQVTSSSVVPLDVEFVRTDVTFTAGDMQV